MPIDPTDLLKPSSGNTCLEHVTLSEGEYVAILNHGNNERSYLTRNFLEAVKETDPLYYSAAQALAEETLNSFSYAVINQEEDEFLFHRPMDNMHSFALSSSPKVPPAKGATEYLLTQSEIDGMYDQANGQITEWLDLGMMASDRAKKAANHNLAMLARLATNNGPL